MTINKIYTFILIIIQCVLCKAQENNFSPYSIFGIGDTQLAESGRAAGMGSATLSLSGRHYLNISNPATLAELDSNTFILDISGSLSGSKFISGNISEKAVSANFTRITAGLHITPRWSGAFSLLPYSSVSYKIESKGYMEGSNTQLITNYDGNGGVSRLSVLNSYKLSQKFSVGLDMMLFFGNIWHNVSQSGITIRKNSTTTSSTLSVGLLYKEYFSDNHIFSVGLTYGYGGYLRFNNTLEMLDATGNIIFSNDLESSKIKNPGNLGLGFSLIGQIMILSADYRFQKWSMTCDPSYNISFTDTHKFNCGIAFIPASGSGRGYLSTVEYQAGFSVSNSYLILNKINPFNFEFTTGIGLPTRTGSQINIGLSYGKRGSTKEGLIRENLLRLSLSLSMAERMFLKRKYE